MADTLGMHPTAVTSLAAFALALMMAGYVATRRPRHTTHWLLLWVLVSILSWTAGKAGSASHPQDGLSGVWILLTFVGVFSLAPAWCLLAAHHTRSRIFMDHPARVIALVVPSVLSILAYLTNPGHRLFIADLSEEALKLGPAHYAGPLMWVASVYGWVLVMAGMGLYLGHAFRMVAEQERVRGIGLAAAAVAPLGTNIFHYFGVSGWDGDFTPAMLGVSIVGLFLADLRFQVLDPLPIARRDVIEYLPDGVVVADSHGLILDVNPTAARLFGLEARDVCGRALSEALSDLAVDEDAEPLVQAIDDVGEGRPPPPILEFGTSTGTRIECILSPVHGKDGSLAGVYALLRDCTQKRRSEVFLRQTQRLETVAALAAGIAHEVNNPLAYVRSNLGHIQRMVRVLDDHMSAMDGHKSEEIDELRLVLEESVDGLDRIRDVIDHIRRFARLEHPEMASLDMDDVVQDAVRIAALHSGGAISLDLRLGTPHAVRGAKEHLVQAVLNLIVNARQAAGERADGKVSVETRDCDDRVEVTVRDNGPGIAEELQGRVFDPFFTTRGPGGGAGLGLAISFDIAREHGGVLELRSGDGAGCEFVLHLPRAG